MNILFLIGNGFDLNLGMKTSYKDFYKFYTSTGHNNELLARLKKEINTKIENWSDLELAIGRHTKELNTTEEFNLVYEDIEDNLADYLHSVENNFDFALISGKGLYGDLVYPERHLPPVDKERIEVFKGKWNNTVWNINFITFNYTKSLEILLDYTGKHIDLITDVKRPALIEKIEHIHGYYNHGMVLGVNDISQVSNKEFHNNEEILETLVKKDCYKAQKRTIDSSCKKLIQSADLICIFGSSIGDTDNMWWQLIGEQLKRDCILIIFEIGEIIPPIRIQKGIIAERKKRNYFLQKTDLNEQEKEQAKERIFVSINSDMFKPTLK